MGFAGDLQKPCQQAKRPHQVGVGCWHVLLVYWLRE